ncbi:MAG: 2,3,4,5-tetrahydropyridine-2,6-dicarboxylate N-succinyltransferase [Caulobacterales bacterium]|jgi:2,3,4,5-tetrahydropyridine-2-carboxylate N-succinyltransferase
MTDIATLASAIDALWARRNDLTVETQGPDRDIVDQALGLLDKGTARVAEPDGQGGWQVNQWLKQAVLLSFRLSPNRIVSDGGPDQLSRTAFGRAYDKVHLKTAAWSEKTFEEAGFRMVPGAIIRRGAFVARGAVVMPSFINIGAHVGEGAMIDTWATVGSCAQIGKNVHISGGAGIGGVLEPLQANPVIIEDDCFIGARAEVAEGVIVRQGAVLSMGVYLGASTKIVHRETGEIIRGEVPAYSVVVPGTIGGGGTAPALYCAVIVKQVDAQTRAKTAINELLRD